MQLISSLIAFRDMALTKWRLGVLPRLRDPFSYLALGALFTGAVVAVLPFVWEIDEIVTLWAQFSWKYKPSDLPLIVRTAALELLSHRWFVASAAFSAGFVGASLARRRPILLALAAGLICAICLSTTNDVESAVNRSGWNLEGRKPSVSEVYVPWEHFRWILATSLISSAIAGISFSTIARFVAWRAKPIAISLDLTIDTPCEVFVPARQTLLLSISWYALGNLLATVVCLLALLSAVQSELKERESHERRTAAAADTGGSDEKSLADSIVPLLMLGLSAVPFLYQRFRPESGWQLLQTDARAPILYLRSFASDGLDLIPTGYNGLWTFFASMFVAGDSVERRLRGLCNELGPFVAIGRPGEQIAEIGAARMYLKGDAWRQMVCWLARKAQCVVLTAGRTSGLSWEYQQVRQLTRPECVHILIPLRPSMLHAIRDGYYRKLRPSLVAAFGESIPTQMGNSVWLVFDEHWQGHWLDECQADSALKDNFRPRLKAAFAEFDESVFQQTVRGRWRDRWRLAYVFAVTLGIAVPVLLLLGFIYLILALR